MPDNPTNPPADEVIEVNLREPWLAALLAWLVPGAGHFYQRRYAKGTLFMFCVLSTFFVGLVLGQGRVVYASRAKHDFRWQYICQVGAGLPALPALLQSYRVAQGKEPLFSDGHGEAMYAPPPGPIFPQEHDSLAEWHLKIPMFEMGTLYTMIAGLLNILAIYDAAAGPMLAPAESSEKPPGDKSKKPSKPGS